MIVKNNGESLLMAKKTNLPLISVVMLNWNGLEDTKTCIATLRKNTYPNFEIIIVDNGSTDGSKEWLKAQNDVVLVDLPKNLGVTGGHNKGYEAAKGTFIANLNNDTVVDPDWLWALYRPMETDNKIAVVGGKAYEWDDENPKYNESNGFFTYQVVDLFGGYAHTMRGGNEIVSVNSISTVGALMRRSAIEKVGYFDDDFFAYYDETDQFARFKRAGYKIIYTPEAKLWHMIGGSTKGFPYFYLYHMHRNRFMFAVKNYDRKYLGKFLRIYTRDSMAGLYHTLRGRDELNDKARYKAFFWNMFHAHRSFKKRREIMALGSTYNGLLLDDAAQFVSIIITCYNYEEYVEAAIKSALAQTQEPLEIIVINDGSTDKSLDVINKYKDQITIIDKKNEGVIAAKNQGLIAAKGEWVIYLDADDILEPTYIQKTLRYARKNNYDVVYTDMQYIGVKKEIFKARPYTFRSLLYSNYVHNSSLYNKVKLHQAGGYKDAMKGGFEDWEINISLAENKARFGYFEEPLLHYRQHENTRGRNNEAQKQAAALVANVRKLHRRSYLKGNLGLYGIKIVFTNLVKHPLLPFVALFYLPVAILKGIVAGLRRSKSVWLHSVRNYIHKRRSLEKRKENK